MTSAKSHQMLQQNSKHTHTHSHTQDLGAAQKMGVKVTQRREAAVAKEQVGTCRKSCLTYIAVSLPPEEVQRSGELASSYASIVYSCLHFTQYRFLPLRFYCVKEKADKV